MIRVGVPYTLELSQHPLHQFLDALVSSLKLPSYYSVLSALSRQVPVRIRKRDLKLALASGLLRRWIPKLTLMKSTWYELCQWLNQLIILTSITMLTLGIKCLNMLHGEPTVKRLLVVNVNASRTPVSLLVAKIGVEPRYTNACKLSTREG